MGKETFRVSELPFLRRFSSRPSVSAEKLPLPYTESESRPEHVLKCGWLEVGGGHEVYYEEWGNPSAKPIIHLHGGPGADFNDSHKGLYDPSRHRVIFFSQRGCGKSRPFGELENNTPKDLVEDIEKLRTHLGITGKAYVFGGSWGSTLALEYAKTYPQHVEKLGLWSLWLARKKDIDILYLDQSKRDPKFPYHEARKRFLSHVPEKLRKSSLGILKFYHEKMSDPDPAVAQFYAAEYHLNTYTVCSLPDFNSEEMEKELKNDPTIVVYGRVEAHYILNMLKKEKGFNLDVLKGLDRIKHIPTTVIAGVLDYCTPKYQAEYLKKVWDAITLKVTGGGHIRYDERGPKQAIQKAAEDCV